jgi:hypothetical protein
MRMRYWLPDSEGTSPCVWDLQNLRQTETAEVLAAGVNTMKAWLCLMRECTDISVLSQMRMEEYGCGPLGTSWKKVWHSGLLPRRWMHDTTSIRYHEGSRCRLEVEHAIVSTAGRRVMLGGDEGTSNEVLAFCAEL